MNKFMVLRKARLLRKKRRQNKIKKQVNYVGKTHKGVDRDTLKDNLKAKKKEKMKEEKKLRELKGKIIKEED